MKENRLFKKSRAFHYENLIALLRRRRRQWKDGSEKRKVENMDEGKMKNFRSQLFSIFPTRC